MPDQAAYTTNYHPWEGTVLDLAVNAHLSVTRLLVTYCRLLRSYVMRRRVVDTFFFNAIANTLAYTHLVLNPFFFFFFFFFFFRFLQSRSLLVTQ